MNPDANNSVATELGLGVRSALEQAALKYGTPCYVYFLDQIIDKVTAIKRIFGGRFEISYAMKANPHAVVLRDLSRYIDGIDVSSGGELERAIAAGYEAKRISFTGPAKSIKELSQAIDANCGEIVAESMEEVLDIDRLSSERGITTRILLRISPQSVPKGFGVNMGGRPSQFGIDEEMLDPVIKRLGNCRSIHCVGYHIYSGAQCLNENSIVENCLNYLRIFKNSVHRCGMSPEILVFGAGIGIPYHIDDRAVDLNAVAARLNPALDDLRQYPEFHKTRLLMETGRLLVGEAGYFLTTVKRAKHSRGKEIRICDGGLNNHLAACGHFGTVIHRNYVITKLQSRHADQDRFENGNFDIFGPLCTTIDQLARNIKLPSLKCGDILAIHNSGAYGFTASPMQFISHPCAKEIVVKADSNEQYLFE